jgi:hypothetical protein
MWIRIERFILCINWALGQWNGAQAATIFVVFLVRLVCLGARGKACVALIGRGGRWDMSAAKLRKTRDYRCGHQKLVTAPLLHFAADTLPSLHPGKCV